MKAHEAKAVLAEIENKSYVDLQKENAIRCYLENNVSIPASYLKPVIAYLLRRLDNERKKELIL